ncbi:MAG: DUF4054 domain-containing protein [Burkholderiales bacterium]|nr:DUF4054 domain-containing protein [Burkholderiales bacterium]
MNVITFRQQFAEFADVQKYPDAVVNFWLDVVTRMLNADRWSDLFDIGLALALAHHLVLATKNEASSLAGKSPGATQGVVTSKSVDTVSVNYDVSQVMHEGGGFWNLTSYGIQFLGMARMVGAGGVQL